MQLSHQLKRSFVLCKSYYYGLRLPLYYLLVLALALSPALILTESLPSFDNQQTLVSSFYGPGVVLSWILSMFWVLASAECKPVITFAAARLRVLFNAAPNQGNSIETELEIEPSYTIDASFLSVIIYPTIAALDSWRRLEWSWGCQSRSDATEPVIRYMTIAACLALWSRDVFRSKARRKAIAGMNPDTRTFIWTLLGMLGFPVVMFRALVVGILGKEKGSMQIRDFVAYITLLLMPMSCVVLLGDVEPFAKFSMVYCITISLHTMLEIGDQRHLQCSMPKIALAWPQTQAKLSDLDQWSALLIVCVCIGWEHLRNGAVFVREQWSDYRVARSRSSVRAASTLP